MDIKINFHKAWIFLFSFLDRFYYLVLVYPSIKKFCLPTTSRGSLRFCQALLLELALRKSNFTPLFLENLSSHLSLVIKSS